MTEELLQALLVILQYCLQQNSCEKCPMAQYCDKMPCEWE